MSRLATTQWPSTLPTNMLGGKAITPRGEGNTSTRMTGMKRETGGVTTTETIETEGQPIETGIIGKLLLETLCLLAI